MNIRVNKIKTVMAAFVSLPLLLSSCSMMTDDRSDCPDCRNPLHIKVRYDYNTARANMFHDHVEEATVYVVDPATGNVVDQQTARNTVFGGATASAPLRDVSFGFNFEGLAPGSYRLYATGRSAADATIAMTSPAIAEAMSKLQFTVPADAQGNVSAQRMDTVWNTLTPVDVVIPEKEPTEATIPLMRLTNDLNVMIFRRDGSLDNGHERYDVRVVDENPMLDYDNQPTADRISCPMMTYRPFAAWTTETTVGGETADREPSQSPATDAPHPSASDGFPVGTTRTDANTIAERNAHYDLSLSRLVYHKDDASRNPRLIITNREDGYEIVNIDLCYILALARTAYEYEHYGIQEYLDREYDYRLDFGFERKPDGHDTWKYVTIHIHVLSWALRIQNEEL